MRLDPNYAAAYNNRGDTYEAKKDFDRAMLDYNHVIRLDSNYVQAYHGHGLVYYYKGDYDRAIADFTQALRLNPNYTLAPKNLEIARRSRGR